MNRLTFKDISLNRISKAIIRRSTNLIDLFFWYFSKSAQLNKSKLRAFKDTHLNETCYLLANGPSLSKIDFTKLNKYPKIGMNRIYLEENDGNIKIDYLVCINELLNKQFADDFINAKGIKFMNWNSRKYLSADNINYLKLNPQIKDRFSKNISKPISSGGTVTFACLQLAYYMGFRRVIIVGLDHNFYDKGMPNKVVCRD